MKSSLPHSDSPSSCIAARFSGGVVPTRLVLKCQPDYVLKESTFCVVEMTTFINLKEKTAMGLAADIYLPLEY